MALFLVQHGLSAPKDIDPEKGLSDFGREETNRIAQVAKMYKIPVQKIVHSGKNRAEQTASVFHEALALETPMEKISGIQPMDDFRSFAATINPKENLMVVGHMPFMERLVSFLTTGTENCRVFKFQNSGIVCLDMERGEDNEADWFIKWTLNPNIS
ncbi:MAG: phosphohistidine phosphatase SixA [Desulfobulbaceae bacterium]|nr:phosphohistidine phosphatase SixA [Desulfobulbaceae bacterium]